MKEVEKKEKMKTEVSRKDEVKEDGKQELSDEILEQVSGGYSQHYGVSGSSDGVSGSSDGSSSSSDDDFNSSDGGFSSSDGGSSFLPGYWGPKNQASFDGDWQDDFP